MSPHRSSRVLTIDLQSRHKLKPGTAELSALLRIILKNPKRDLAWLQRQTETDLEPYLNYLEDAGLIRVHDSPLDDQPAGYAKTYSITASGVSELANLMFPGLPRR
ncbi:hypothetical protein [Pedobacter sp. SYP-B3415]|uniref:hypothetical protein n=1 Tax=Pedobacter sp. SYP-B3415 TaxID=2496641 RepID=UPI00101CEE9B|nr:hypothetical protein [Pedobacter sp. SYP-B3415]